jgi:hypothetical protein
MLDHSRACLPNAKANKTFRARSSTGRHLTAWIKAQDRAIAERKVMDISSSGEKNRRSNAFSRHGPFSPDVFLR